MSVCFIIIFPSSFCIQLDVYDTTPETQEQGADFSNEHTYTNTQDPTNDEVADSTHNSTQDPKYDEVPDSPMYSDVPRSPSYSNSDAPGSGSKAVYGNVNTKTPAEQKSSKQVQQLDVTISLSVEGRFSEHNELYFTCRVCSKITTDYKS